MENNQNENQNYFIVRYEGAEVKIFTKTEIKSIWELNLKIYEIMNIHPYFQKILGKWIPYPDEDDNGYYGELKFPLENGIKLGLINEHKMSFETENGFSFALNISQSDSIYEIKNKIEKNFKIPIYQQKLSYNNVELKDENKLITSYDKANNSNMLTSEKEKDIIKISFIKKDNINVFIIIDDKKEEISINPLDTIGYLYELLEKKIGRKIEFEKEILKYGDEYIFMTKTLLINHHYFKDNVVLNLTKNPFYIFIKLSTGRTIVIYCNQNDEILRIKELIFEMESDPPIEVQRLIYAGKQLDDIRTLSDYNIQIQSTFHLVGRLRGG